MNKLERGDYRFHLGTKAVLKDLAQKKVKLPQLI